MSKLERHTGRDLPARLYKFFGPDRSGSARKKFKIFRPETAKKSKILYYEKFIRKSKRKFAISKINNGKELVFYKVSSSFIVKYLKKIKYSKNTEIVKESQAKFGDTIILNNLENL